MKKILLIVFILGLSYQAGFAQRFRITAIAFASDSLRPIPFANVSIKGKAIGVMANERGVFQIFCTPFDTVVVSAIGFEPRESVYMEVDSQYTQRVFLKRKIYAIGNVEIKGIKTVAQLKTAILNIKLEPEEEIIIPGARQYKGPLDPLPATAMNPISLIYDSNWAKKKRSKKWSATQAIPRMK